MYHCIDLQLLFLKVLENPSDDEDGVNQALHQMQKKVINQLNKSANEAGKAKEERDLVCLICLLNFDH
jgi:hypothetical protein